jgi:flavin-dependent dehydrogenase
MTEVDAIVVGGGVAGCASALELLDAGWRVEMLHHADDTCAFESLSPEAVRQLDSLSIRMGSPFNEVVAWWGTEYEAQANHRGARVVQRSALAAALRARTTERGAKILVIEKILALNRLSDGWGIEYELPDGGRCRSVAKYIVDGTGRVSIIGRRLGAQRVIIDELFCVSSALDEPDLVGTWTESTPDGWWNLCCDREAGTLCFFSNAVTIRKAKQDILDRFYRTQHLKRLVPALKLVSSHIRACGSSYVLPSAGSGWICVGDAVSTLQPLASAGVLKALRDARLVLRGLERDSADYDRLQRSEFRLYAQALAGQYALERRWFDSKFWAPRATVDLLQLETPGVNAWRSQ